MTDDSAGVRRGTHTSHWGAYLFEARGESVEVSPHPLDPAPSALLRNVPSSLRHRARVRRPAVRRGWLEHGPGPDARRGSDAFVEVSWDRLEGLLADELARIYGTSGATSVFGGSYGWGSAGRFHHPQSQVHRFLNAIGGYTRSSGTYSFGAAQVILPRVLGRGFDSWSGGTDWSLIAENAELVVAFGGLPTKNMAVTSGGVTRHHADDSPRALVDAGVDLLVVSPIEQLAQIGVPSRRLAIRPATDVALMLAIAHTLLVEKRHDRAFLDRYSVGFDEFAAYVAGVPDGVAKDAAWAAEICGIPADDIRSLAREMSERRTMITMTWSLQRGEHGEQPPWLGVVLAAMLGTLGSPGLGFGHGYGSAANMGASPLAVAIPTLPQGSNPVDAVIPVSRIADMLLGPGEPFDFDGRRMAYPDIRLVYWCGGNPFHHHQDLARLASAFARPETVVVHENMWTATARHADIVIPATMTLEREDIGASKRDPHLIAMHRAVDPVGEARDDFTIFGALATRLGAGEAFTEGRDARGWLRHLYAGFRTAASERAGIEYPDFDEFWRLGYVELPTAERATFLGPFRDDPDAHPLRTPSGRIEITSETIRSFGYDDCGPHPRWFEPVEWLGGELAARFPLHLVADQPKTRLHSQLDTGAESQDSKIAGREPVRMNPIDAAARGLADGDVVRLVNDVGSCLAGLVIDDAVRPSVVQLATGAWWDPIDREDPGSMCVHGNPNVLTSDRPTSRLAQSTGGQHALVEVEPYTGVLPPIRAYDPPLGAAAASRSSPAGDDPLQ